MCLARRIGDAWLRLVRPQWTTFIAIVSTNFLSYNYVFLVSFCSWYQTCCFRSIMLYVYMWRVRFNGWKCAIVRLRVLVPPLNPFPYAPTLAQDETQLYFIITIVIKTTHSWLLWDFFSGRWFFNGFWLTKSKKRACICVMKLRYNYLVNLLL